MTAWGNILEHGHTLLFLRHGRTRPDPVWRYTGQREVPLTSAGRQQAQQWAQRLADRGIQSIWASPAGRCLETADVLEHYLGCTVHQEPALTEIDLGDWEGLSREEVRRMYPGAYEERGRELDAVDLQTSLPNAAGPLQTFSMRTAQALYSAVRVTGSKAGLVSQLAQFSRK